MTYTNTAFSIDAILTCTDSLTVSGERPYALAAPVSYLVKLSILTWASFVDEYKIDCVPQSLPLCEFFGKF